MPLLSFQRKRRRRVIVPPTASSLLNRSIGEEPVDPEASALIPTEEGAGGALLGNEPSTALVRIPPWNASLRMQ